MKARWVTRWGRPGRSPALLILAGLMLATAVGVQISVPAAAQIAQPSDDLLNIQADRGIEWHQDRKAYVARGRAVAVQGGTTLKGEVLTAFYRESETGERVFYRVIAEGNVHLITPSQQVWGERGDFDLENDIGVMTGGNLRMETGTETVFAERSLEYYEQRNLAVARGNAVAIRGEDRIRADILVAQFVEDAEGRDRLERLDGHGNVIVTTPKDVARSRQLLYSVKDNVAILNGDVRITTGDDQINGDAAEMDLTNNVNKVLSNGGRVQALFGASG